MGTSKASPSPYPPQPQYYVQQPTPAEQPQPQYQQYQQQPPQQPQYYFPPQQQQYAPSPPVASEGAPPAQQFLAELDAEPKRRTSSTSSASSLAPAPLAPGAAHDGGAPLCEMPAEGKAKPANTGSAAPANGAQQQKPTYQANPWGFFLPDDLPDRRDSTSPAGSIQGETNFSVVPLKITKTGPGSPKPEEEEVAEPKQGKPQSGIVEDPTPQPVLHMDTAVAGAGRNGSVDSEPLSPAPLNINKKHSIPNSDFKIPPAGTQLPYPPESTIPDVDQVPEPGVQIQLPIHPPPASCSAPVSAATSTVATPSVVTPLTPASTGQVQQPQYSQAPSQQAYTQAAPVGPVFVQSALPPTLPMNSYFPQQPSYAGAPATASAHNSPAGSVSSSAQEAALIAHQLAGDNYAAPPPSYDQAVSEGLVAASSPPPSQTQQQQLPTTAPLSPNPTGTTVSSNSTGSAPASYPFSPGDIGAVRPAEHQTPSPPVQQASYPYNSQSAPPVSQQLYANMPQGQQPNGPSLPSSPMPGYGQPQSPYGRPPPRPGFPGGPQQPPLKSGTGSISATAKRLFHKTTDFVDNALTPYLQDGRYRSPYPYNHYQYQYQHQYQYQYPPGRLPPGQYYPQPGYGPPQPTYAIPQAGRGQQDMPRPA